MLLLCGFGGFCANPTDAAHATNKAPIKINRLINYSRQVPCLNKTSPYLYSYIIISGSSCEGKMFTGIIESTGRVVSLGQTPAGARLTVDISELAREVKPGGSVAVNGVCLTAIKITGTIVDFDVVYETLSRTNLGTLFAHQAVNIERALRATDRIDGHFVLGHIDTTCRIAQWQDQGAGRLLTLQLTDSEYARYIIPKGSVALDGISLTVAGVSRDRFSIALIPTTLEKTTLITRPVGAMLNLETDILVRTVVYQLQQTAASDNSLMEALKRGGFTGE